MTEIFRVTAFLEGILFFIAMIFFFTGTDRSTWYAVPAFVQIARSWVGFAMGRVVPKEVVSLQLEIEKQIEEALYTQRAEEYQSKMAHIVKADNVKKNMAHYILTWLTA